MTDKFEAMQPALTSPVVNGVAINVAIDQTYTNVSRAIHLSTAGVLVVILESGVTLTMGLEVGWHPIRAIGHVAAGSSACVGHALW